MQHCLSDEEGFAGRGRSQFGSAIEYDGESLGETGGVRRGDKDLQNESARITLVMAVWTQVALEKPKTIQRKILGREDNAIGEP